MGAIKSESLSHDVLKLAKMLKGPIDLKTVMSVYGYIDRPSKVNRSFEVLYKHGYVNTVGDGMFQVTPLGVEEVYKLAKPGKAITDD